MAGPGDDLSAEQTYVSVLYDRLDQMRATADDRRTATLRQTPGGTQQARGERDAALAMYSDQLAQLNAVESGLCFGRLDFEDDTRRYVGRIGIFDEQTAEPLLLDWRAPAARPFYLATAAAPDSVRRRRHIRTRGRTVVELDDEVLDLANATDGATRGMASEAVLLAAVGARRTGRMRDIVETIQAEQDDIIRADLSGVLVVAGGPGTGKTAVALHRAAYLLYTHRQQLSTRGVLVVGPNRMFLRYIAHVLPSLAETGVLLSTVSTLYPGLRATGIEDERVAGIKGRESMVSMLMAAVADRQEVPAEPIEIPHLDTVLVLSAAVVDTARRRARRSGRRHNQARTVFEESLLAELTQQVSEAIGTDPYADDPLGGDDAPGDPHLLGVADLADITAELAADPAVRRLLDELWPVLTPRKLLRDLYASPARLAVALPGPEGVKLARPADAPWTPADVPLLDEAAELLGPVPETEPPAAEDEDLEYARGALEILYGSRSLDAEILAESEILDVNDLLDAGLLAQRQEHREYLTTAQRAAADREWAFGHVIIDEAQELSPMAWRLLMRRCPSRSMTIVGDLAQTGDLAGASSWESVLSPFVGDRWRLSTLSVNYRTPSEIMDVAARVMPSAGPARSVRSSGHEPWDVSVPESEIGKCVAEAVAREARSVADGRLGVIVPASRLGELEAALRPVVPELSVGDDADLERPVVLVTVKQAKGLEFDTVIVVDPDAIVAASARGRSDLYVALTRATQRLGIVRAAP
jgi:DNA helicase IV